MLQIELGEILKKAQTAFAIGNYDEAKKLASRVREQLDYSGSKGNNEDVLRAEALFLLLQLSWKQGRYEDATAIIQDVIKNAELISSDISTKNVLLAKCYNIRGLVYWKTVNYLEAIKSYATTLDICENMGEKIGIAIATGNIGILYSNLGDNSRALEYYEQALAIHKELGNESEIAETLCNIGVNFYRTQNYHSSLPYFLDSLEIFKRLDNRAEASHILVNIANYYLHIEEYSKVLDYLTPALAIFEELNMQADVNTVNGLLGMLYSAKDFYGYSPEKAKSYLFEAIEIGKKIAATSDLIESYRLLAGIYRNEENWKECAKYSELYVKLELATKTEDAAKVVQRFALERETAIMKREKEILKVKNKELAELNEQLNIKNRRLREIDEEKNDLLDIVSHDLKNPLGAITMIANVLTNESRTLTPDEIKSFADDIHFSSERMFKLIIDLLDINKIESGLTITDNQIIYADDIVRNIAIQYKEATQAKGITINRQQIVPVQVYSSPSILAQILDNLISNAVKYSFYNTEIILKTEIADDCARISIADKGPGLTESDKNNIFGKFKRLSAQPTGGEHSTRLGLSIVKKLVETIGGEIRFESELGQGTTFIVELPV